MTVAGLFVGSGGVAAAQATAAGAHSSSKAHRVMQPVIVRAAGDLDPARAAVVAAGGVVEKPLGIINGFSAMVPANAVAALRADAAIGEVSPNGAVKLDGVSPTLGYDPTGDDGSLHSIESAIGATSAWSAGVTGAGVDVALIDSGVSPVKGLDEPGKVVNGPDLSVDASVPGLTSLDQFGHGTHMGSIIAGRDDGATTPKQYADPNTWVGVAPDAGLVNVKVGAASGAVDVSQVIAGIDWVVQNAHTGGRNIKVLNLSFGTNSVQPYTLDPLDYAAEVAWRAGIVVVASAGNDGSSTTSLQDPADDPFVIAVGAENTDTGGVVKRPTVASFTNFGNVDRTVDVIAPGVHVLGLRDPGSVVDSENPSAVVGGRFFRGSGTSQAAAVVSGAAALLAQRFPTATPDELKYMLTQTAAPLKGVDSASQGAGVIQVGNAINLPPGQLAKLLKKYTGKKVTPKDIGTSMLNQVDQPWVQSTGTGSLEASRGSAHLTDPLGTALQGEVDVWGGSVNTAALAKEEIDGTAWTSTGWNGNLLLGNGLVPTLYDHATTGSDFTNMRWSNMRWSGDSWANMRWSADGWLNMRWADLGWLNMRWADQGWLNMRWSGGSWS